MGNKNTSLAALLRDDPVIAQRIKFIQKEVERDTIKIKSIAGEYNQRYKKEIELGTAKKHLLLEDGKRRGKSVEEVEATMGFIPSIYTPILNWLYYFMNEGRDYNQEIRREQLDEAYRTILHNGNEERSAEKAPDMTTYIYGNITMEKFQTLKKLKRLSRSPNEHEAFAAYRKCLELCKDHRIDFDRIPD